MNNSSFPLRSGRVLVRKMESDDLQAFQAYRQDERLAKFQGWSPWSDDEALVFIEEMSAKELCLPGQWIQLSIVELDTDKMIGDIGLFLSDDQVESKIGYTLASSFHGCGYATEAVRLVVSYIFAYTSVERILGITDTLNSPSIRVLERLGMKKVFSEKVVFKGEPCIEDTYELRKSNYSS